MLIIKKNNVNHKQSCFLLRKWFLFAVAFLLSGALFSQQKELTLRDAVFGEYFHLAPQSLKSIRWRGQSDKFTFIENKKLMEEGLKASSKTELFSLADLNKTLQNMIPSVLSDFPSYDWENETTLRMEINNHLFLIDISTKQVSLHIQYDEKSSKYYDNEPVADFCPVNRMIAYSLDNNLLITDKENKVKAITNDAEGIVNGQIVHRNEFGINQGTFWSPLGNYLAFYRMDESMVTKYPLADFTTRVAEPKMIRYPMAGMKSHEVKLAVYTIATGKTIFMQTGEPAEQYLTNICWSPDEKYIFIAVLNREQNHMKLNQYDVVSGAFVKTLFEEKNDKYVEPLHSMMFLEKKTNQFIWQSERDGYNHLYLYSYDGKLVKQLTTGNWVVTEILGTDPGQQVIYFSATRENPTELHAYSVHINTGEIVRLTQGTGTHQIRFANNKKYFIDIYENTNIPRQYDIITNRGKPVRTILKSDNPLKEYKMGALDIFTIKSADNQTDLYCMMIKPPDFDENKKYPVLVYLYGGPHAQMVTNTWLGGAQLWLYYMAQKGYIVFTLDNRGSDNRGQRFEDIIHRNVGKYEMQDQMKGIEYLRSLKYVDAKRMGIHGWSYGGFMTISMMLNHNDIFKAGVAGGPVIDWKFYEVMYGERYMDTPQENPEGYENSQLENKVKNLKGDLLIIHGGIDDVVVPQNSVTFIEECIQQGVQVDYFVYPVQKHNVFGMERMHLMEKIMDYFDEHL